VHRRPPLRPAAAVLAGAAGCALFAAGCGSPPELRPPDVTAAPSPPVTAPATTPPALPTLPVTPSTSSPPSPTGFAEAVAVPCAGRPGARQVITVLRRAGLLSSSANASVTSGPLCAGTWQWSVIEVAGREPLQVVTRGAPGALRLVTAGTDVCSIPVRTGAPAGIRAAASCSAA
jgi:hypothetical protein